MKLKMEAKRIKKYFYSDIVTIDTLVNEMADLKLTFDEVTELSAIAHEHLHETILDAILSELTERDKKIFLANLEYDTHDRVWKHLNAKVENVEGKIRQAAERLKQELRGDIARIKANPR